MKVTVKRSGGYAGIEESVSVDTESADETTAAEIARLVDMAGALSQSATSNQIGADLLRYEISFGDDDPKHQVIFQDDGSPEKEDIRTVANRLLATAPRRS